MNKTGIAVVGMVLVIFGMVLAAPKAADASDTVRLQVKWLHQAQFAGFYVAIDRGFYRDEGIEVSLIEGGPGVSPSEALIRGDAQFAVLAPENVLVERSRGNGIRAVAAIYRKSAVVFLSKKESNIVRPSDFAGKTIAVKSNRGIQDFGFQFRALMENMGVGMDGITLVPYDPAYKDFRAGTVDITPAYLTGGFIKLQSWNIPLNVIYPGDYRVRFYSDTLAATDRLIETDPELVHRFLKASLKGWQYAIENIPEATGMVMNYARIKDRSLQMRMLEAAVPLVHTGNNYIGWMTRDRWQGMHRILLEQQILKAPVNPLDSVFTMTFLKQLYETD